MTDTNAETLRTLADHMQDIERGQVWVEKPCAATRRRGYARRVVVEWAPDSSRNGRVEVAPAPGWPGSRSHIWAADFLRRFAHAATSTIGDAP